MTITTLSSLELNQDIGRAKWAAGLGPVIITDRDALIAATALVHGLTVVTRNTAYFQATGVALTGLAEFAVQVRQPFSQIVLFPRLSIRLFLAFDLVLGKLLSWQAGELLPDVCC